MSPAWKFLALAALSCCCSYVSAAGRLSEREITLPVFRAGPDDGVQGVPVVNPPKRIAGYFKLNRTHDAVSNNRGNQKAFGLLSPRNPNALG